MDLMLKHPLGFENVLSVIYSFIFVFIYFGETAFVLLILLFYIVPCCFIYLNVWSLFYLKFFRLYFKLHIGMNSCFPFSTLSGLLHILMYVSTYIVVYVCIQLLEHYE